MLAHLNRSLVSCSLAALFLTGHAACGSSTYLIERAYLTNPNPQGIPAQAADTGEPRFVSPRKMYLDRAQPLTAPLPDGRLQVKPRRPKGLIIAGAITLGIGTAITLAGVGELVCPPGAFCENGVAVGALLGVGSFHLLIGGIQLIAAGAKWSPEVSRPYSY